VDRTLKETLTYKFVKQGKIEMHILLFVYLLICFFSHNDKFIALGTTLSWLDTLLVSDNVSCAIPYDVPRSYFKVISSLVISSKCANVA